MCGITGFCSTEKEINLNNYYNSHLLIKHRGPDDEGFVIYRNNKLSFYKGDDTINHFNTLPHIKNIEKTNLILGHRRLSIIDLSYHGHQPLSDEFNNYVIVYNGEIYNYIELREELENYGYKFYSKCDSEIVLKSYIHWKDDAFNKFNGMWALAIFDKVKNTLILSRDRFGIKPLYYSFYNGILYFASEIKFLKSFLNINFSINKNSVNKYLNKSFLNFSENTFWNEIKELQPGYNLKYRNNKIKVIKYWRFKPKTINYNYNDALEKLVYLFEDSIKLRMRSDVEVGSLLSGGLDSSLIACSLNKLGYLKNANFKSFSAVFNNEKYSEKKYIDLTVKENNLNSFFIYPKPEELENYINKMISHIEEPFRSLSVYSQFLIYETIHKKTNVTVLLNGQGADELFAGYTRHYYFYFAALIKKLKIIKFLKEYSLLKRYRGIKLNSIIKPGFFLMLLSSFFTIPFFNKISFKNLTNGCLREYLKYDDRTSMAFGKEARVPFLDYRIVEFAFSLNENYKINNFINKRIQRDYAKRFITNEIINRKDKMGFISPQEKWQRNELKNYFDDVFNKIENDSFFKSFDLKKILSSYKEYHEGFHNNWDYIWRIFCLYMWKKVNKV